MLTDLPDSRPGRRASRPWLAVGVTAAGLGMIPWLAYLAVSLPASPTAWHWRAAWVGLDGMEAAGLVSTGILLLRRDARACLTAAATAALLLSDAWFDMALDYGSRGFVVSLLEAILVEIPLAVIMFAAARRLIRLNVHTLMRLQGITGPLPPLRYVPLFADGLEEALPPRLRKVVTEDERVPSQ